MTKDDKKITDLLRKIRALKAKAEDPSVTEAESLAFAGKVAEMLAQYGLEESQLSVDDQTEIEHEDYVANWNASPARRKLAIAVCRLYMVHPLIRTHKSAPWTLVGRKHNIIMVKEMTAYLIAATLRLSNRWGRENPGGNIVDFRRGCFQRLHERLEILRWEQARAAEPQYTPSGNPGNLPALYKNERQLTQGYIDARWSVGKYRERAIKQGDGAMAGRAAGDRISLNQQVGSGSKSSAHLLAHRK